MFSRRLVTVWLPNAQVPDRGQCINARVASGFDSDNFQRRLLLVGITSELLFASHLSLRASARVLTLHE